MASIKGSLFEFFVSKLLMTCGFKQVVKDGLLIFDGRPGTMIQGLGQIHNADVLLEPPFQTPFYCSTRLLVECKCYDNTIGLPVIRNALGLREDINSFDIVTEEILQNRKAAYTKKTTCYPMKRYSYQVAVASFSGFKSTAIPFAQTHRIPLISFSESNLFQSIRNSILKVETRANKDEEFAEYVLQYLREYRYDREVYDDRDCRNEEFISFIRDIKALQKKIVIGLLEEGTMLFMIKNETDKLYQKQYNKYDDGCEIHWSHETEAWELKDEQQSYFFELPKEIYHEWIESAAEQKKAALQIKQDYFSKIVLFENDYGERNSIRTLHLSERFIETAKRDLNM